MSKSPSSSRIAAAALVATFVLAAPQRAWADDDSPEPKNIIVHNIAVATTADGAVLERLTSAQDQRSFDIPFLTYEQPTWAPVCVAPCRANVDLNGVYRVGPYNGVTTSHPFTLTTDVSTIHVRAGSGAVRFWGNVLSVVGVVTAVSGFSTAFAAGSDTNTQHIGYAVGAAGVGVFLAVALPMILLSGTHVAFD